MGYFLTDLPKLPPAEPDVRPKTHTPFPRVKDRGRRFYSPNLGRWTNRDPSEERGGRNLSLFVLNAPTRWIDSLGLTAVHVDIEPPSAKAEPTYENWPNFPRVGGGSLYTAVEGVRCSCVCEDPARPTSWQRIVCSISWKAEVFINKSLDPSLRSRWTPRGIYGHEQKHLKSMEGVVDAKVAMPLRQKEGRWPNPFRCEQKRSEYQTYAQGQLVYWLERGGEYRQRLGWHEGEPGAPSGSPRQGEPYEPLPDSPSVPDSWENVP
jgi:hypothetical protein